MFGEPAHLTFRHAQHLGHFRERAARLERRKPAHHRAMFRPVFFENQIHHVVLAVVREINVDVRQFVQRHAFLVQKPAEIEVEADRAHVRNAEAVADQAVRRAAARDPFDAAPAAVLQKIPGDQKIILVADLGDDRQFHFNLRPHLFQGNHSPRVGHNAASAIAPAQAFHDPAARNSRAEEPSGDRNAGNCGLPKGNSKWQRSAISCACASQSECPRHPAAISAGVRK